MESGLILLYAILAGGTIGMERTFHGRPAGFRTHILVCVSAALLTLAGKLIITSLGGSDILRADPTRMAQGILTGIGFIGAGVIMKEGLTVRGLTTAASIWMTASVGIVLGLGLTQIAFEAVGLTIIVLIVFRWLELITPTLYYRKLQIHTNKNFPREKFERILDVCEIKSKAISFTIDNTGNKLITMTIVARHRENFQLLAQLLSANPHVEKFSIQFKD